MRPIARSMTLVLLASTAACGPTKPTTGETKPAARRSIVEEHEILKKGEWRKKPADGNAGVIFTFDGNKMGFRYYMKDLNEDVPEYEDYNLQDERDGTRVIWSKTRAYALPYELSEKKLTILGKGGFAGEYEWVP